MQCSACGQERYSSVASPSPWCSYVSALQLSPIRDVSCVPHHTDLPQWLKDLDQAVKDAWPTRIIRYRTVAALLLSWEDTDMRFATQEINRLSWVLKDGYGAEVEHWQIPSTSRADLMTFDKVRAFLDQYGNQDNLLLVYYAGHGRPGNSPGGPPVWHSRSVANPLVASPNHD